jgi:hypothetical protein
MRSPQRVESFPTLILHNLTTKVKEIFSQVCSQERGIQTYWGRPQGDSQATSIRLGTLGSKNNNIVQEVFATSSRDENERGEENQILGHKPDLTQRGSFNRFDLRVRSCVCERGRVLLSQVRREICVGAIRVNEERDMMSHPVLEGKPNANHVRARIRIHVHNDYIIGHHHTMLEINNRKVLNYIKMSETSTESNTYP